MGADFGGAVVVAPGFLGGEGVGCVCCLSGGQRGCVSLSYPMKTTRKQTPQNTFPKNLPLHLIPNPNPPPKQSRIKIPLPMPMFSLPKTPRLRLAREMKHFGNGLRVRPDGVFLQFDGGVVGRWEDVDCGVARLGMEGGTREVPVEEALVAAVVGGGFAVELEMGRGEVREGRG